MKKNILIISVLAIISSVMLSSCFFDGHHHNYAGPAPVGSYKLVDRKSDVSININDIYYLSSDGTFKYRNDSRRGYYILKYNRETGKKELRIAAGGTPIESSADHGEWDYHDGILIFNKVLTFKYLGR